MLHDSDVKMNSKEGDASVVEDDFDYRYLDLQCEQYNILAEKSLGHFYNFTTKLTFLHMHSSISQIYASLLKIVGSVK